MGNEDASFPGGEYLPSEDEIKRGWEGSRILVSVILLTYNQENYVDDAVAGILRQQTRFPFEIIIHDDASTDGTRAKLAAYKGRYPSLIKLIQQVENQYSKSPNSVLTLSVSAADGDYLAYCEGDDFWVDKEKLQLQYDALISTPGCQICFHPAYHLAVGQELKCVFHLPGSTHLTCSEMILADSLLCPSASLFFSRSVLSKLGDIGDFVIGDFFLRILLSVSNGSLYLHRPMSVYRVQSVGSWTEKIAAHEKLLEFVDAFVRDIESFKGQIPSMYHCDLDVLRARYCRLVLSNRSIPVEERGRFFARNQGSLSVLDIVKWFFLYKRNFSFDFVRRRGR